VGYTYPAPAVQISGTTIEISEFLRNPVLIRRRLQDITALGFIADYLLPGHYQIIGGSILYETGEEIFPNDVPTAVAPGSEFPLTGFTQGVLAAAHSVKWGQDALVTDEAITRLNFDPVNRGLLKLGNSLIRQIDSVALGVIASKTTQSYASGAVWTGTGEGAATPIIESVLTATAQAQAANLDYGTYDYDTVVLTPLQFAKVATAFLSSTLLPREQAGNAVMSGVIQGYLGKNWVTSNYVPVTNPFVVDRNQLGGMADEQIQSPGYGTVPNNTAPGIEAKSLRDDDEEQWRLRARRVTVPVVLDPRAAFEITGTGL
jgi:hypothetical protein